MSKQDIDLGTRGNSNTGDDVNEAFAKVEANFTELYDIKLESIQAGTSLTVDNTDPLNPVLNATIPDQLLNTSELINNGSDGTSTFVEMNELGDLAFKDTIDNSDLSASPGLSIKGNNTGTTGSVLDLTPTQVRAMLNIEDGATPDRSLSISGNDLTISGPGGNTVTLPSSGGSVDFDDVPTDGSIKAVRSNGIFDALSGKINAGYTDIGSTLLDIRSSVGFKFQETGSFTGWVMADNDISFTAANDDNTGITTLGIFPGRISSSMSTSQIGAASGDTLITKDYADLTYSGGGSGGTVDQTIIDGSTNAVSGNAVNDGLALKPNLAGTNNFTGTAYWTGNVFANVLSSRYHQVTNTPLPTNTDNGSSSSGVLRAGDQNGEMVWLGHTAAMIFDNSLITSARTYTMPNKSGTVAMTSDIVENTSGTWTPVITTTGSASYTYNTSVTGGIWTKVGKTVTFKCTVVINSKSGTPTSSALQITGFPFVSKTIGGYSAVNPVPIHHTKFLDVTGTVTGALSGSTFVFFQPDLSNAGEILPVNYSALRGSASGALTLYGTIIVD
ncbi:virion structural protein [Cellulophaga phage phi14:2]|uniref:Structural protein n=1 Tax=Cellulophaga phage phi14:2 TaxID=1327990 RepID=S0A2D8_9CAUD|nr:virion structural protein [Cellulophaga phage phi14:2]AGO48970.1 structural protein [Cellulophaga phage phi14:2]